MCSTVFGTVPPAAATCQVFFATVSPAAPSSVTHECRSKRKLGNHAEALRERFASPPDCLFNSSPSAQTKARPATQRSGRLGAEDCGRRESCEGFRTSPVGHAKAPQAPMVWQHSRAAKCIGKSCHARSRTRNRLGPHHLGIRGCSALLRRPPEGPRASNPQAFYSPRTCRISRNLRSPVLVIIPAMCSPCITSSLPMPV